LKWYEISITTTSEGVDAMSELLYEAGVKGVVIEDREEIARYIEKQENFDYVDQALIDNLDSAVKVKGYLPADAYAQESINLIRKQTRHLLEQDLNLDLGTGQVSVSIVDEQDWAESWKKYFKPTKVGESIVVKPTWEAYAPCEGEIVLEIDPGMAFGTGTHETTVLCLKNLEKWILPDSSVLDVGCGTGILGIAAILLGAKRAVCVDIDPDAVRIAGENAQLNRVNDRIEIICGDLVESISGTFDILVANISSSAIEKLVPHCKALIAKKGVMIFSGIINDRCEEMLSLFNNNDIELFEKQAMGDWLLFVGRYA